jgi:hypothetical protein
LSNGFLPGAAGADVAANFNNGNKKIKNLLVNQK